MSIDIQYMRRCFELARMALPQCRPNPGVGCVLVRGGCVVGEGHTQLAGQAHAEIMALQQAGTNARGATAYVSFEPCAHHGRTGPCAQALIDAGVTRVVYALEDPNPLVNGKGLAMLRAAGVTVDGPLLADEAEQLNRGFMKRMRTSLPFVRMKLAMSLDGRTAMASGESKWITGEAAREEVHRLRAESCAVLSGGGTVAKDDPQLNVRLPGYNGKQPLRVIADSDLRTPPTAKLLHMPGQLLIVNAKGDAQRAETLRQAASDGCELELISCAGTDGRVDLRALFQYLAREKHCNELLVETGGMLSGAVMWAGLVDELILYVAPKLLGSDAQALLQLPGIRTLAEGIALEFLDVAMVGKDCRMRLRVLPPAPAPQAPLQNPV
jgi:diaminohydroxyphosphoribosylaminopyrimidine deaminase/5-amino-6-(5-phosphoribosylamino)uracil reductase